MHASSENCFHKIPQFDLGSWSRSRDESVDVAGCSSWCLSVWTPLKGEVRVQVGPLYRWASRTNARALRYPPPPAPTRCLSPCIYSVCRPGAFWGLAHCWCLLLRATRPGWHWWACGGTHCVVPPPHRHSPGWGPAACSLFITIRTQTDRNFRALLSAVRFFPK